MSTTAKLTYTKQIRGGKLRATEMEVGASVTGTLVGFKEGKDFGKGPTYNLVLDVNGREVEIYTAGNLKFLKKDVDEGKKALGTHTVITREANKDIKGRSTSQFTVTQEGAAAASTATAANAGATNVMAKLQEIRAKQGN